MESSHLLIRRNVILYDLTVKFEGQNYTVKLPADSNVAQLLSRFREERGISRFSSLELRIDERVASAKRPIMINHVKGTASFEIIRRSPWNCC